MCESLSLNEAIVHLLFNTSCEHIDPTVAIGIGQFDVIMYIMPHRISGF